LWLHGESRVSVEKDMIAVFNKNKSFKLDSWAFEASFGFYFRSLQSAHG